MIYAGTNRTATQVLGNDRSRRPPPPRRHGAADRPPLVRRRCLPHGAVQRALDELSGRRAVLHRLGAQRLQGVAGGKAGALSAPRCRASSARKPRTAACTALYNAHLEKLGLVNDWAPRAPERLKLLEGVDVRHWLGITAANEHFTAILADWMLRNPDLLGERRPAPDDPLAVAQRRGIGAQEHRVRPVPGAGRQPRMAHHVVAAGHHHLPGGHPAPDA